MEQIKYKKVFCRKTLTELTWTRSSSFHQSEKKKVQFSNVHLDLWHERAPAEFKGFLWSFYERSVLHLIAYPRGHKRKCNKEEEETNTQALTILRGRESIKMFVWHQTQTAVLVRNLKPETVLVKFALSEFSQTLPLKLSMKVHAWRWRVRLVVQMHICVFVHEKHCSGVL